MSVDVFKALRDEQKLAAAGSPLAYVPCAVCNSSSTCERECTYFSSYTKCNSTLGRKNIFRSLITDAARLSGVLLELKKFPPPTKYLAVTKGEECEKTLSGMPRTKVLHRSVS